MHESSSIEKSSQYFIHNLADDFKKHEGDNIHNLLVYHEGYDWGVDWQCIDDWSWYDKDTKTAVIMWATDLLPGEVEEKIPVPYDADKTDILCWFSRWWISSKVLCCCKLSW